MWESLIPKIFRKLARVFPKQFQVYEDPDRELFVWYISQYIGDYYKWGGDDPSGFDCSGLAIEGLKAVDLVPRGTDMTADKLRKQFPPVTTPYFGCLVFWGTPKRATHVEIAISKNRSIGASGGGRRTLTIQDAIRDNAFIKLRPIVRSKANIVAVVDPFLHTQEPVSEP